ncbi:MAG: nucleotidyltransferase domain-containing protein [Candidatus Bathyarchaeia archaeon]|nr:nucleotidyltransferase domain-containing protein [Candidatus Bathyarchaeota archaeon]
MSPKEKLKREAFKRIRAFMDQVRPLRPRLIMLYGSYARGDFTELSDVDVCLVAEDLPEDVFRRRSLSGLYRVRNVKPVAYYPGEFLEGLRKPNLFLYDILAEGVVIYNDGFLGEAEKVSNEEAEKRGIFKNGGRWIFKVQA